MLDGITYGKGAVFLNQLIDTLGEDKFFCGVKAYFQKYAWKNVELKDFIGCLADAVDPGFKLKELTDVWLKNPGCNKIIPETSGTTLTLKQYEYNPFAT